MKILKKILVLILTIEARLILLKYRPFIIAVTGSVGKTSTKDAIYSVLKNDSSHVRKSEKSLNSEIGLPLTILGVPNAWKSLSAWLRNILQGLKMIFGKTKFPECLILEVGADHPGDIKRVAKWLRPHIAVLTKVSDTPVHVEFFKSPKEVFEEKASLLRSVRKGGTAVLFADDQKNIALNEELVKKGIKVVTYGTAAEADIAGSGFGFDYVRGSSASVDTNGHSSNDERIEKKLVCRFGLAIKGNSFSEPGKEVQNDNVVITFSNPLGRTGMYPLLAAVAVAKIRGMETNVIIKGINEYEAPKGRMNVLNGIRGSILIDDTYNSSPDAVMAALGTLRELTCPGRKIAILADMMELGKYSAEEHRRIGAEVVKVADMLITVGQRSRATAEEAIAKGMNSENIKSFDSSNDAADYALSLVKNGDLVLIKGSQSTRMERVTKDLLNEGSKASTLLVRQEKEWLDKK